MAGTPVAPIVGQVAKTGFQDILRGTRDVLEPIFSSGEAILGRTTTGKALKESMLNFEQSTKSGFEKAMQTPGANPTLAMRSARRMGDLVIFGKNRQFISDAINDIRNDPKGGPIHARNVADAVSTFFKEQQARPFIDPVSGKMTNWRKEAGLSGREISSPYRAPTIGGVEQAWKNIGSWLYLSRIAIPHIFQPLNVAMTTSWVDLARGAFEAATNYRQAKLQSVLAGAFTDEMAHAFSPNTPQWQRIAEMFHMPGFTQMRKFQITASAMAGKYSALGALEDLSSKVPREVRAAQGQLRYLGIDPNSIVGGKLSPEQLEGAMYKVAKDAMYIRGGLEVPSKWETTSLARLTTQYKGFTFNQSRLMYQTGKRKFADEGMPGLLKFFGTVGIAFPVAGELIWSVESALNRGDPNDRTDRIKTWLGDLPGGQLMDEYISAQAHMAGLGVAYSLLRAAQRNNVSSYFEGPLLGLVGDEIGGLGRGATTGNFDQFYRTNLRKVPVIGPRLTRELLPTHGSQQEEQHTFTGLVSGEED